VLTEHPCSQILPRIWLKNRKKEDVVKREKIEEKEKDDFGLFGDSNKSSLSA